MQLWVAISSLILLLTDAVVSYVQVNGVVGHPATLPCTYSTASGVTTMCWGRGACPISHCLEEIVWTNGSHVTFQKHLRYKLKGKLSEGDVSLTIENAAQTDSGQYCCRVEHRGWFNDMKLTLSLEIKPAPAASETVRAFLGQSVILPCTYSSWSQNSNSMCWGKGECPKSKCNDELLHTNGRKVLSRKSSKYELRGSIRRGDVSLTIFNTNEGDSGVYCCRVEVPGWFNDVKKNIHLQLSRAPTTTHSTTHLPKATSAVRTATTALPTMAMNIPELTTRTPLQTRTTTALTTVATTCPPTRTLLPEATTVLPTAEFSTEGPILTAASETFFLSSDSERSTEVPSGNIALFTSQESEDWVLQSTSQVSKWEMSDSVTFPQTGAMETEMPVQNKVESEQVKMVINSDLLMIIAPSLGFVLLALLVAFFLRGKVMKSSWFPKHTRLDNVEGYKNNFDDMQHGREDEDGLFTL